MLESKIQSKIVSELRNEGKLVLRLTNCGVAGVPDVLVLSSNHCYFIEFKSERGHLSEIQKVIHRKIKDFGFDVEVVNSTKKKL